MVSITPMPEYNDLIDIDLTNLKTQIYGVDQAVRLALRCYGTTSSADRGYIWLDEQVYHDVMDDSPGAAKQRYLQIQTLTDIFLDIDAGEKITFAFKLEDDSIEYFDVFLPELKDEATYPIHLFPADDGSTYWDKEMTQLAQAAPAFGTIEVAVNLPDAAWNITGPLDYSGVGSQIITNALIGDYTITYLDVTGYTTPLPETKRLPADQTITFSGYYLEAEGFGTVIDFTADKTQAHIDEEVNLSFAVRNDGGMADDIFARVIDEDTGGIVVPYSVWSNLAVGETGSDSVAITMPNKTLNLLLEAGHVEEEAKIVIPLLTTPESADYFESFDVECTVTNNEIDTLVYIRLVDNDNNYIINQVNVVIENGQSEIIKFSDVYIACNPKNITIECGVLK